jgi:hypothetical protein
MLSIDFSIPSNNLDNPGFFPSFVKDEIAVLA